MTTILGNSICNLDNNSETRVATISVKLSQEFYIGLDSAWAKLFS